MRAFKAAQSRQDALLRDVDWECEVRHSLQVKGYQRSHEWVTERIGLKPTEIRNPGELINANFRRKAKISFWSYTFFNARGNTEWVNGLDSDEPFQPVLDHLEQRSEALREVQREADVYFKSVQHAPSFNVVFTASRTTAKRISSLDLDWVFDGYAG